MCVLLWIFRVTSPANYFLSELAYSAASELTDCKPLSLYVITLGDSNVYVDNASTNMCPNTVQEQESSAVNVHHKNVKASCSDCTLSESCDCCTESNKSRETFLDDKRHVINDSTVAASEFVDVNIAVHRLSTMLVQDCKPECFILDIDLDFFSTINPFLSLYTARQYQLLSELYAYTPPPDGSVEVCLVVILPVSCEWFHLPVFHLSQNVLRITTFSNRGN